MKCPIDIYWVVPHGSSVWGDLPLGVTGDMDAGWGYRAVTLWLDEAQVHALLESSLAEVRHGAYTIYIRRSILPIRRVVADLDGTLVQGEALVWLARTKGLEPEIEQLTEACILGRVSFAESFAHRLRLLAPTTEDEWRAVARAIPLAKGAEHLHAQLGARGITFDCASGALEPLVAELQMRLGYERYVCSKPEQYILDSMGKRSFACHDPRPEPISPEATLTIGDGANDLEMLASAGHALLYSAMPIEAYPLDKLISQLWLLGR